MKIGILITLFTLVFFSSKAKEFKLSSKAEISVITCAPGNLIYECFGHTAIRVNDPEQQYDLVFNYGIFEFNKPNFELNFAKGYLEYKLGVGRFSRFVPIYTRDNRTITEQVLNLDSTQKQKLFNFLIWNEKPENRYYFYDYFFNNCATKIRDVIEQETGAAVNYSGGFKNANNYTIRDLIRVYAHNNEWSRLGIDLCLGFKIDKIIDDNIQLSNTTDIYSIKLKNLWNLDEINI
ncbi:MAG: DUF4105 domain-containing protein, partial [Bacteroidia bacterium]